MVEKTPPRKVPTLKELQETCLDHSRTHPGIDLLVARAAVYITKILLYTPVRPLQIMFFWFFLQIFSCGVILKGTPLSILGGVLLYQLSAVLDSVDGQVARIKQGGKENIFALYLDQVFHWINHPLLFLSLAFAIGNIWLGVIVVGLFFYNKMIIFNPYIYNLKNEKLESITKKVCWTRQKVEERNLLNKMGELFRLGLLFNVLFLGATLHFLNQFYFKTSLNFMALTLLLYGLLFFMEFVRKLIYTFIQLNKVDKEGEEVGKKENL